MTQDEIKSIISDNPGILQSEVHKHTDISHKGVQEQVMALYKKGEIRREKWKKSNKLYIS